MSKLEANRNVIKPAHKALRAYYAALQQYADQQISHETALRSAFQNLLAETANTAHWTLVPELSLKVGGKTVRPDGTLRDKFYLPRGYWEAKDTADDLAEEIRKKIAKGYPLTNSIFEDTRHAVLYQDGQEQLRVDLRNPQQLADLLSRFYTYAAPDIEGFEQAVSEFQERVPELARGLDEKIKAAHQVNKKFQNAFASFFALCQSALNPNISRAAVDEMLVQHLLTERLIRKIFDNSDFINNNVIAVEIEKVIRALVSQSFNRDEFLRSLDRFYRAIEDAARNLEEFSDKQHFLNSIYERFFQGYSVKLADTHGIVYTPQPLVDFMCASVVEVLQTEFGKTLGDEDVLILDPCTGTGNFVVNLLRRAAKRDLESLYRTRLFANEIMLLPYYIAALNIEHAYYELTGTYEPFEGLCFVDTLELAEGPQLQLGFMTEENTARVQRQKDAPITVIIGNPPYNMNQQNENDNNKNRKYNVIDKRVSETYAKDSKATLRSALSDPYVKFFRWASDRLQGRDGIICMVTNNSFVDQIAFDGMRKHLLQDFTCVYHMDLHGNIRQNPKLSGTTHNVFGIQVGVGITVAVRSAKHTESHLYYHRVPENWRKEEKLSWLIRHREVSKIDWQNLLPNKLHTWLIAENTDEFSLFVSLAKRETNLNPESSSIFKDYSPGVNTSRDDWAYDFSMSNLAEKMKRSIQSYNYEVFRLSQEDRKPANIDNFVNNDPKFLKWTDRLKDALQKSQILKFEETRIRLSLYRPFEKVYLYFDHLLNQRQYGQPSIFPTLPTEQENKIIALTNLGSEKPFMTLVANTIVDYHLVGAGSTTQCFPFYTYDKDGTNRRENITDWALNQFRQQYAGRGEACLAPTELSKIEKWDIFYYVYGVLHHPAYRTKFADNLKRELPRIPFAPDFWAFAEAGRALADLHLHYEIVKPYRLDWVEAASKPLSVRVERMKLSKDKTQLLVNETLTLAGIPPETFFYRLGNRSALEWVIDQYQVTVDKRSGITSDPNRTDEPRYIIELVERVIAVSVATVKLVAGLPDYV